MKTFFVTLLVLFFSVFSFGQGESILLHAAFSKELKEVNGSRLIQFPARLSRVHYSTGGHRTFSVECILHENLETLLDKISLEELYLVSLDKNEVQKIFPLYHNSILKGTENTLLKGHMDVNPNIAKGIEDWNVGKNHTLVFIQTPEFREERKMAFLKDKKAIDAIETVQFLLGRKYWEVLSPGPVEVGSIIVTVYQEHTGDFYVGCRKVVTIIEPFVVVTRINSSKGDFVTFNKSLEKTDFNFIPTQIMPPERIREVSLGLIVDPKQYSKVNKFFFE